MKKFSCNRATAFFLIIIYCCLLYTSDAADEL